MSKRITRNDFEDAAYLCGLIALLCFGAMPFVDAQADLNTLALSGTVAVFWTGLCAALSAIYPPRR